MKLKDDRRERPSLIRALWNAFGTPILMSGFFKLITDGSQFLGPMIMQVCLDALTDIMVSTTCTLVFFRLILTVLDDYRIHWR